MSVLTLVPRKWFAHNVSASDRELGANAVGIMCYNTTGNGRDVIVLFIHVRTNNRAGGIASSMVHYRQARLTLNGRMSASAPSCTTRSAVIFWLKMGFVVDDNIWSCVLHDSMEATTPTGATVGLTFTFRKAADVDAHAEHVRLVFAHHSLE